MIDPLQTQRHIKIYEKLQLAAALLNDDYMNDKERTICTALDGEGFMDDGRDHSDCGLTGI